MVHPFSWLPDFLRTPLLVVLVAGSVAFSVWLAEQGRSLRGPAAPYGVASFEFAWSRENAAEMIDDWRPVLEIARRQVQIDFGFLVFYPLATSLACAMLAESRFNGRPATGVFLSWAVLAAGPLDAAENLALLHQLNHGAADTAARVAACCAGVKFALVLAGFGYLALVGAATFFRRSCAD